VRKLLTVLICFFSLSLLAGCVYKVPVQQGNIITDKEVAKLHRGMSPNQVARVMGNPVLDNIYLSNKVIYVYTIQKGYRKRHERRLYVTFVNNKVTNISFKRNF